MTILQCRPKKRISHWHLTSLIKGGILSHRHPRRFYKYALLDPLDAPFTVFRYYCRRYGIIYPQTRTVAFFIFSILWLIYYALEQLKALGITSPTPSIESSSAASDNGEGRLRSTELDDGIISFASPDYLDLSVIDSSIPDHLIIAQDEPSTPPNSTVTALNKANSALITDSDASPSPLRIPRLMTSSSSQGPHTPPPLTKASPSTALSFHLFTPPNQQRPAATISATHKPIAQAHKIDTTNATSKSMTTATSSRDHFASLIRSTLPSPNPEEFQLNAFPYGKVSTSHAGSQMVRPPQSYHPDIFFSFANLLPIFHSSIFDSNASHFPIPTFPSIHSPLLSTCALFVLLHKLLLRHLLSF